MLAHYAPTTSRPPHPLHCQTKSCIDMSHRVSVNSSGLKAKKFFADGFACLYEESSQEHCTCSTPNTVINPTSLWARDVRISICVENFITSRSAPGTLLAVKYCDVFICNCEPTAPRKLQRAFLRAMACDENTTPMMEPRPSKKVRLFNTADTPIIVENNVATAPQEILHLNAVETEKKKRTTARQRQQEEGAPVDPRTAPAPATTDTTARNHQEAVRQLAPHVFSPPSRHSAPIPKQKGIASTSTSGVVKCPQQPSTSTGTYTVPSKRPLQAQRPQQRPQTAPIFKPPTLNIPPQPLQHQRTDVNREPLQQQPIRQHVENNMTGQEQQQVVQHVTGPDQNMLEQQPTAATDPISWVDLDMSFMDMNDIVVSSQLAGPDVSAIDVMSQPGLNNFLSRNNIDDVPIAPPAEINRSCITERVNKLSRRLNKKP